MIVSGDFSALWMLVCSEPPAAEVSTNAPTKLRSLVLLAFFGECAMTVAVERLDRRLERYWKEADHAQSACPEKVLSKPKPFEATLCKGRSLLKVPCEVQPRSAQAFRQKSRGHDSEYTGEDPEAFFEAGTDSCGGAVWRQRWCEYRGIMMHQ